MKTLLKRLLGKQSRLKDNKEVVLSLSFKRIEKFKGFLYTPEEGQRLSKRSYTELPEFKKCDR